MLKALFFSPWYVAAAMATVFAGLTAVMFQFGKAEEAAKVTALAVGQPALVVLDQFDPDRDVHAAGEVHLQVALNGDHNTKLVETRKKTSGSSTETVRYMFTLFSPGDGDAARTVRAAVIVYENQRDVFADYTAEHATGFAGGLLGFTLSGEAKRSADLDHMFDERLEELGLRKHKDFTFVEPWLKGREAALQPDGTYKYVTYLFLALVGFIGLVALLKFRRRPKGADRVAYDAAVKAKAKKDRKVGLVMFAGGLGLYGLFQAGLLGPALSFLPIVFVGLVWLYFSGLLRMRPLKGLADLVGAKSKQEAMHQSETSLPATEVVFAQNTAPVARRMAAVPAVQPEPVAAPEPATTPQPIVKPKLTALEMARQGLAKRTAAKPRRDPFEKFAEEIEAQKARMKQTG